MASPANPKPNSQPQMHSPYCADPNCKSCNDLRQMHELIRLGKVTR
jgi:hypothetical protein